MPSLRDIKRRIKSVKNTQQITKAMKMVAAAKLKRAHDDIVAARPYTQKMLDIINSLASRVRPDAHPLLSKREGSRVELLILTSDRGLCGGFNSNLIRTAEGFIRKSGNSSNITLNLVGKKGKDYFKRRDLTIRQERPVGSGRPKYAAAAEIGKEIVDSYIKESFDETYLIYSEFKSALSQQPVLQRLLPIEPPAEVEETTEYIYEPSQEAILADILPKYIEMQIFKALLETSASEHGARMAAMDSATKNAKEMIEGLTLRYNRLRQAAITKELMEIIGGAEALKG
ncbi:MAG: F0F1 ATP synthase subunit gamma [Deltaproteobacteria bacterium RIFCSPLOWO2_12_FULL_43_16]|nr:MAG: F0F1 ATP synthase subunit gamma [Deltaproteobacteria bacterium GWA2_43_19]OGQ09237.1 MAG: F0F1 ATP synthase subunit gamma [Deltaproteobacteria bacterium RIFCSPHIGHO2_02_FULL_43_33]OGQ57804.1 MAG: F0F1 ATP synthase subunit gamma [Deltaproteobacteria bacterium RIFCSPLOWO2_12_FULL_43_16]